MNAHSSPIALCTKPLIERSVITGAPSASRKRIAWPATASASSPCLVWIRAPLLRISRSMSLYWVLGVRSA
jgi:hypothetical protein